MLFLPDCAVPVCSTVRFCWRCEVLMLHSGPSLCSVKSCTGIWPPHRWGDFGVLNARRSNEKCLHIFGLHPGSLEPAWNRLSSPQDHVSQNNWRFCLLWASWLRLTCKTLNTPKVSQLRAMITSWFVVNSYSLAAFSSLKFLQRRCRDNTPGWEHFLFTLLRSIIVLNVN